MKLKIAKSILYGLMTILVLGSLWILIPRIWSDLHPDRPPVGYHFQAPAYVAVALGWEQLIDRNPPVPEEVEEIKNIEYKSVQGKSLQLDLYKPRKGSGPLPLLVFVHGGAWKGGKRSDYLVYLLEFAKRGYVTATVSYRLLKDGPYPACVEDVTDAVRWFYDHGKAYGYDSDRIALVGGSAGAHLSLLAAYGWKSPRAGSAGEVLSEKATHRIKAVVDIYGPADLTTEYSRNHPLVINFISRSFAQAPELYTEASPIHYVDQNDPPTLILHGTSDELVPVSQSDQLKARLDRIGVPCEYYRFPLWPHTMDVVQRVNDFCKRKMSDFFERHLK